MPVIPECASIQIISWSRESDRLQLGVLGTPAIMECECTCGPPHEERTHIDTYRHMRAKSKTLRAEKKNEKP